MTPEALTTALSAVVGPLAAVGVLVALGAVASRLYDDSRPHGSQ